MVTFVNVEAKWVAVSCILLSIDVSSILSGFHAICTHLSDSAGPITMAQEHRILLPQPVEQEEESVAMVYLTGLRVLPSLSLSLKLTPFRVFNQSVYITIDCQQPSEV
jgi:hypothetical protein